MTLLLPLVGLAAAAPKTMDDQIAAYKAAGEPIEPKDFEPKGVADADNAAAELRAAFAAFKSEDPAWQAYEKLENLRFPLTESQVATLRAAVAVQQGILPHIDAAMTRPAVDWQIKFTSPIFNTLLPYLNEQRQLAQALVAHALLAHHDGNDAEAIKDINRLIFISRTVDHQVFTVTHLVSLRIMAQAANTAESIAPDLKIGAGQGGLGASDQDVKQLITSLLDDVPPTRGYHDSLLMERMDYLDVVRGVVSGKINPVNITIIDPPMPPLGAQATARAQVDGLLMLRYFSDLVRAFDTTADLPSFKSHQPARPAELDAHPKDHPLGRALFPRHEQAVTAHYRATADRRLAAVALAIRMYAIANNGTLPKQLEQLIPQYLPQVPLDPMTAGQPLKYEADRSIVYSVGDNGADDAGSEEHIAGAAAGQKPQSRPGRWQQRDVVAHLVRASAK
jgi:hypothetical protein